MSEPCCPERAWKELWLADSYVAVAGGGEDRGARAKRFELRYPQRFLHLGGRCADDGDARGTHGHAARAFAIDDTVGGGVVRVGLVVDRHRRGRRGGLELRLLRSAAASQQKKDEANDCDSSRDDTITEKTLHGLPTFPCVCCLLLSAESESENQSRRPCDHSDDRGPCDAEARLPEQHLEQLVHLFLFCAGLQPNAPICAV